MKSLFYRTIEDSNGRLLWTGAIKNPGKRSLPYGWVCFRGKAMNAHRAAWIEAYGEIPKGMYVCHKCDVPRCINPNHLFLGTASDNMADMWSKSRHKLPSDGVIGSHNAKLTVDQVKEIKRLLESGVFQRDLAKQFGVSQAAISGINRGKTWYRYV